jgi:hypothetical protein
MGFKSLLRKKYVVTTDSKHKFSAANNEFNRELRSSKSGEKWVSDINYIRVQPRSAGQARSTMNRGPTTRLITA